MKDERKNGWMDGWMDGLENTIAQGTIQGNRASSRREGKVYAFCSFSPGTLSGKRSNLIDR